MSASTDALGTTMTGPNNAFKPKPLRYAKHMAGTACHVLRSTTRLGLTLVLGAMEFESIRPVLSGVAGGIIATWLTSRWARRLPSTHNGKSRHALLRQHRPAIWTANTLFFLGLFLGVALYRIGGFDSTG